MAALVALLSGCEALVLECNHDSQMLADGPYPPSLQQRVGGRLGHLGNHQAAELLAQLNPGLVDLVLVEGFKQAPIPKIEVYRPSLGRPLLADSDPGIIAIASDGGIDTRLPVLNLNDPAEIAGFIIARCCGVKILA